LRDRGRRPRGSMPNLGARKGTVVGVVCEDGEIRRVILHFERHDGAVGESHVWRLARGPSEAISILHAAETNAQHRGGVVERVRMSPLRQLGNGDGSGSGDLNATVRRVKGDRRGA